MPTHTFKVNGRTVSVDAADDVRLLWVLRDLLGITGPKYGCGINVCKACTSHLNGKAFNPCSVPVEAVGPDDEVTTIEGLPDRSGRICTRCRRRGSSGTSLSAGTASPGR